MIVCIDLETTGLSNKKDKIIEVALVKFDEQTFEIIEEYSTLVNPGIEIPELNVNITNITDADVVDSPSIESLAVEIEEFIGDAPVLGHNVVFDRDFLVQNWVDIQDNIIVDTFFLANFLSFGEGSLSLESLSTLYNIHLVGAHRALSDVKATIELFEKLSIQLGSLNNTKKSLLAYIFQSSQDKNIAFLERFYFSNFTTEVETEDDLQEVLTENIRPYKVRKRKEVIEKRSIWEVLEAWLGYEQRENQNHMFHLVEDAYKNQKHICLEAPTWVGKTLGYSIPSILHALKHDEKIYISTKTKILQNQIFQKDLKSLSQTLDFRYCMVKGKRNYLGVHAAVKYFHYQSPLSYEQVSFFAKLFLWSLETKLGELDELNFYSSEYGMLKFISADSPLTRAKENPFSSQEFFLVSRKNVLKSDLIVLNHSLLFQDISSGKPLLQDMKNLVVDEAHNIEETLTESLKKRYSTSYVDDTMTFVENVYKKQKKNFHTVSAVFHSFLIDVAIIEDYCIQYLSKKNPADIGYKNCLIQADFFDSYEQIKTIVDKAWQNILSIVSTLREQKFYDFSKEADILEEQLETLKKICNETTLKKNIHIIQYSDRNGIHLETTLLEVWEYLQNNVWKELSSVVLTSATLQISENFSYVENMFGLENFEFHALKSDFDYAKQALLYVPNDLWDIKRNSDEVKQFLSEFLSIVWGNTLVLLTSLGFIKNLYLWLNFDLKSQGIHLYAQSVGGSKQKILDFYTNSPDNSVILWTNSFWEWVDMNGDMLKYLVIHKFPFQVPTDPIFLARSALFQNAFSQYSMPKSILKLKQWFGRLIRSKTDTGIVVLLDNRIYSTQWWKTFFNAFPQDINYKTGSSSQLMDILSKR